MADTESPLHGIAALRARRGETLEQFAQALGIRSKGRMSQIENGLIRPSPDIALRIEALSGGTIDAAALSPIVAAARRQPEAA